MKKPYVKNNQILKQNVFNSEGRQFRISSLVYDAHCSRRFHSFGIEYVCAPGNLQYVQMCGNPHVVQMCGNPPCCSDAWEPPHVVQMCGNPHVFIVKSFFNQLST